MSTQQTTPGFLDLAAALPQSEEQWQRQCEIEQQALHYFTGQRVARGHSAAAIVFGGQIELALLAKSYFAPEKRSEVTDMLCAMIREAMASE